MKQLSILIVLMSWFIGCSGDDSITTPLNDNLSWNKQIAVAYVHSYATVISQAALKFQSDSSLIDFIRKSIDPISFYSDSSGYFYVYDYNCLNIAHARQKDLQGQNLYNYTDTKGKFVLRELADKAQSGGGYVEFHWIKPGETGEKKNSAMLNLYQIQITLSVQEFI
jgi:signal transduction histidine kinase